MYICCFNRDGYESDVCNVLSIYIVKKKTKTQHYSHISKIDLKDHLICICQNLSELWVLNALQLCTLFDLFNFFDSRVTDKSFVHKIAFDIKKIKPGIYGKFIFNRV